MSQPLLDSSQVIATIERLQRRIGERFPDSSLLGVCARFLNTAQESEARIHWIERPNLTIRISVWLFVLAGVAVFVYSATLADWNIKTLRITDVIQLLEALINDVVLIGAALFFLFTLENRIKRARVLKALHELRSLAHVIDMHQLTKDPSMLLVSDDCPKTASSPERRFTPFQLKRYLDYSSEMLSLIGKIAALYSEHFADSQIVTAANEIEELCTGLARKIWQKIMLTNEPVVG